MRHLVINGENEALENWRQAFPDVSVLQRGQSVQEAGEVSLIWCRLHAHESVVEVLSGLGTLNQPVVILADTPDEEVVVAALEAGAVGCCNSRAAPEVLQQVALVVANGGLWIGQSILQRLVGGAGRALGQRPEMGKNDTWTAKLSERECQVARLVAAGESNKEISEHLNISERTVKAHLTSVFEKLGLRDRLQLSLRINGLQV